MSVREELHETQLVVDTTDTSRSLIDDIEIVGEHDGLIECYVPLGLICTEDVAVNQEHVNELAKSMQTEHEKKLAGSGQLSPILLGLVNGNSQFHIIDGFHRASALKVASIENAYSTVIESTWEEIIDLRILTARTHREVQFARIVEWITDAWERTEWATTISVGQAFALNNTLSSGKILGVAEQAPDIKDWVAKKCDQWRVSASTIYNNLSVASVADPGLVQEARLSRSGRQLTDITPGHLKVIALGAPNRFDLQRLIADQAKTHNLRIPATRSLTKKLAVAETDEEVREILSKIDFKQLEPAYSESRARELTGPKPTLKQLHNGSGGTLASVSATLSQARSLIVSSIGPIGEATPSTINDLKYSKNELLQLGKQLIGLVSLIDSVIDRPVNVSRPSVTKAGLGQIATHPQAGKTPRPVAEPAKETSSTPVVSELTISLNNFLQGLDEMPVILTREEIFRAERVIAHPPVGTSYQLLEDLREEVRKARQNQN